MLDPLVSVLLPVFDAEDTVGEALTSLSTQVLEDFEIVVVDDGWASARHWPARIKTLGDIIDQAGREGRPVALMTTAARPGGPAAALSGLMSAGDARELVENLEPKPWTVERTTGALDAARLPVPSEVVWLSDGLVHDGEAAATFARALARLGPATILVDEPADLAQVLAPPVNAGSQFELTVQLAAPVQAHHLGRLDGDHAHSGTDLHERKTCHVKIPRFVQPVHPTCG